VAAENLRREASVFAPDLGSYEALALALAREPQRLAALRRHLDAARLTAPLFDIDRTRREIEQAYERVWEIHARGEAPRTLRAA
jgi:protein O-GlcNAc transferase